MVSVQREDLNPILSRYAGNDRFCITLEQTQTNEDLLRILGQYIQFNSCFGGGVANLAGEIAVRQDLFRDAKEEIEAIADRSVEVASKVFFAAIDEFGDRSTRNHDTHRSLAQATLKAAGSFFGHDGASLTGLVSANGNVSTMIGKVCDGYRVNRHVDDSDLFRAMGFHLASEILADEEFGILNGHLREKHSGLVEHLETHQVVVNGVRRPAYTWIQVHTSVEADHFDAAVVGANAALQYYVGSEDQERIKDWILEGVDEFAALQNDFMHSLMETNGHS